MELTTLIRGAVLFLILATTLGANMEDNFIARLGLDANYAIVIGLALFCTMMLSARNAFIVVIVVVFSLNANMPSEFSLNFGVDRDYYAGFMFAVLLQPILVRVIQV